MKTEKMSVAEFRELTANPKKNKFNRSVPAERTFTGIYRGRAQTIVFDSKLELKRFETLLWRQEIGVISNLQIKERFPIMIKKRVYESDFTYFDEREKSWVIEDTKGVETYAFKLKWDAIDTLYPHFMKKIIKFYDE